MGWSQFQSWLSVVPLWLVAILLFLAMAGSATLGLAVRRGRSGAAADTEDPHEGLIVSAVFGLLALLQGFTFSMAVDRFDARRLLVLEDANALRTAYLDAQLLGEPHRDRISGLLISYVDNRIALGKAERPREQAPLMAVNNVLLDQLNAAGAAAFDSIRTLDFSSAFAEAIAAVNAGDASRRAARAARVPAEVFGVLFIYMIAAAGVVGNILKGRGGRRTATALLALFTLALMLTLDIDRPTGGGVFESQWPMERLADYLHAHPPASFDRWRTPGAADARVSAHHRPG